jgi:beta-galactosidase
MKFSNRYFRLSVACAVFSAVLFCAAQAREKITIDSLSWKFIKQDVSGAQGATFNDAAWATIKLPHDFNGGIDGVNNDMFKGPSQYRGPAWYRTKFTVDAANSAKKVFIEFEGAALVATVWVNGDSIGQHRGGYTAFTYDITASVKFGQDNVLAVKVTSANDPTVAPWMFVPFGTYPTSCDYGVYGGIYRDVSLIVTDKVKIEATFQTTPNVSAASSLVRVRSEVKNYDAAAASVTLQTLVLDATGTEVANMSTVQSIAAGQTFTFVQTSAAIANPHLWSPSVPYLYTVRSIALVNSVETDRVENKLGFRWYTLADGTAFKLNGQNLFLRGVNRHQDRAGFGYALTNDQHVYDMALIKSAGFNFLRHAHYPADPAVMRACDSLGIMVWLEIPMTVCISTNAGFKTNVLSQLTEMIRQNYNHPSVIVWGVGNESDQDVGKNGDPLTESYSNNVISALNAQAQVLDSTRVTTGCNWLYASNQGLVDVYSPQDWSGWYGGVYTGYNPSGLIGEYGADADITIHKETGVLDDWSQEYQCRLIEYKVSKGEKVSGSCPGQCVWIAFDFASPRADRVIGPNSNTINYMNQKGIFTHDRKAKDAYYFYKSFQTSAASAPMVYIVSHTWLNRWTAAGAKNIWAYSNCDSVELFNDYGKTTFGKRARTGGELGNTRFEWASANVKYNILYAVGYVNSQAVVRDTIVLNNLPSPPTGTVERAQPVRLTQATFLTDASQCRSVTVYSPAGETLLRNVENNTAKQLAGLARGVYIVKYIAPDGAVRRMPFVAAGGSR